jgi:hypothetical protein
VQARSQLSGKLIDAIYRDYFQFSPGIALALEQDNVARKAVLWTVVRPLLAWYALAGRLAFGETNPRLLKKAVQAMAKTRLRFPGTRSISTLLEAISSNKPMSADISSRLSAFAPKLQEAARSRLAAWAILDPLTRIWTSKKGVKWPEQVGQWLANAPVETITPPGDSAELDLELQVLARMFDFLPMARRQLGERLAVAWPAATDALERNGFVILQADKEKE